MSTQQTLVLTDGRSRDERARRDLEDQLERIGVRPPTRYEVEPGDLEPATQKRSPLAALLVRVWRRLMS